MHIERVAARVRLGGHDIPVALIRRRYEQSRRNLIGLLPRLTELRVFNNSAAGDPATGTQPKPQVVLHVTNRRVLAPQSLVATPEWAKAIVAAALKTSAGYA